MVQMLAFHVETRQTKRHFVFRRFSRFFRLAVALAPQKFPVAFVELSPMRFCYIQSQVMTLVGYMTDGILGALTAQTAISAAEAAKDFAKVQVLADRLSI